MEDNVLEFCQWLMTEKGVEAGNLSDYINNNEEEVLKLAQEFKKPKFKVGGKVESAAEMFKCGGKAKKKVKKAEGGEKITVTESVDLGNGSYGDIMLYPNGRIVERITRGESNGVSSPGGSVTLRDIIKGDTVAYTEQGASGKTILYDTSSRPTGREAMRQSANKAKFNPLFDNLRSKFEGRIVALPDGRYSLRDIIHNETNENDGVVVRDIIHGDTIISNSKYPNKVFRNTDISTKIGRMLGIDTPFDRENKKFK